MKKSITTLAILLLVGSGCSNQSAVQPVNFPPEKISSTTISQLTKDQVLQGYDQCGVQFKDGEFSLSSSEYDRLDTQKDKTGDASYDPWRDGCDAASYLSTSTITFVDLDEDGKNEALVPARVIRASSGGVIYVFKNINGVAKVVDRIELGKENGTVVRTDKNTVVVTTDGTRDVPTQITYEFINGRMVKQ